jgi:hypothetical protein
MRRVAMNLPYALGSDKNGEGDTIGAKFIVLPGLFIPLRVIPTH